MGQTTQLGKFSAKMALVHDGLWGIVNEMETAPDKGEVDRHSKFLARRHHALATIVLAVEPSLLGVPENAVVV